MKIILGCNAVVITTYYRSSLGIEVLHALQGLVCFIQSFSSSYLTSLQLTASMQVRSTASSTDPCTSNLVSLKRDGQCTLLKRYCFPLGWALLSALHSMLL